MNTRISQSNVMKVFNIIFLIVLENYISDCGMGFLGISLLVMSLLYTLFLGGIQTAVSKYVSIRNSKGLNCNAGNILKPVLTYVIVTGSAVVFLTLLCTAERAFFAPSMQVLSVIFLTDGITDAICGYQTGNSNAVIHKIACLLKAVLPIPVACILLSRFSGYGDRVSALLRNDSVTNAYMALAVSAAYLITSVLVLFVVLWLCVRMRQPRTEGRNIRSMDSKKMMYGGIFSSSFKNSLHQIFPLLSVVAAITVYHVLAMQSGADMQKVSTNTGLLFSKVFLPLTLIYLIFSEYTTREKYRLHMDYRKQDVKTALIRSQYMIKNSLFLLLPPALIFTFLADPLVKVFYTGQYIYSAKALHAAGFLILFAGVSLALQGIMKASGWDVLSIATQAAAFLVQMIFMVLLMKKNGADMFSVIYSLYVYFSVLIILDFMLLYRQIRFDLGDLLFKAAKYGMASIVVMILFIVLDKFVMMNVLLIILSMILGYLLYYLTLIALRGISRKDEQSLKRTLNYYPVAFLRSRLRL